MLKINKMFGNKCFLVSVFIMCFVFINYANSINAGLRNSKVTDDSLKIANPLSIRGMYFNQSDSAIVYIDSLKKLNQEYDSLVILQTSKNVDFSVLQSSDTLYIDSLLISSNITKNIFIRNLGKLPIESKPLYCKCLIIVKKDVIHDTLKMNFVIGWDRPVYNGKLDAFRTSWGSQIYLTWDAPESDIDSLRIWWDREEIPLQHSFAIPVEQAYYPQYLAFTEDTINGLSNNTLYYVGLQVYKDMMWSTISEKSRALVKTSIGDTTQIKNNIIVDSIWFTGAKNKIIVEYIIDTSKTPAGKTYLYGWSVSLDSSYKTQLPTKWDTVTSDSMVAEIIIKNLVFDTVYNVGLWLRSFDPVTGPGRPASPNDSSSSKVDVPKFTWQIITFFQQEKDTITALGNQVKLSKIHFFEVTDTLWSYSLPSFLPSGFVAVGGPSFTFFPTEYQVLPFGIALRYPSLPAGITKKNLGLYQMIEGGINVIHGFTVTDSFVSATIEFDNLAYPFFILADTSKPVISVLDMRDTVSLIEPCSTMFSIGDNISNTSWEFIFGPGNAAYSVNMSGFLSGTIDTMIKMIKDTMDVFEKSQSYGIRAHIIAFDGIYADTVNISRSVYITKNNAMTLLPKEWTPVRVTYALDSNRIETSFGNIKTDEEWKYNTHDKRIYRWYNDDSTTVNKWVEYDAKIKNVFKLIPGQVIWCKSRVDDAVVFGKGVTTSLRKPFEIILKPNNWTDISTPYQFPILFRDVFIATGNDRDSIQVCIWEKGENIQYEGKFRYIGGINILSQVKDTLKANQKYDAYTIYNKASHPITLVIPPIPVVTANPFENRTNKENRGNWNISFKWCIKNDKNDPYYRVLPCYFKNEYGKKSIFGPMPPTMNPILVGFSDTSDNSLHGWACQYNDKAGGVVYKIDFKNHSTSIVNLECYLDKLNNLADNYTARILNRKTMTYETDVNAKTMALKLDKEEKQSRYVVVGTDDYFNNILKWLLPIKVTLLKTFPNPFVNRMKIQYTIPEGIKEMRFDLYDIRGRVLWQGVERGKISRGSHIYLFNNSKTLKQNSSIAAGVYIIRLSAVNKKGVVMYGGERKVTCVK